MARSYRGCKIANELRQLDDEIIPYVRQKRRCHHMIYSVWDWDGIPQSRDGNRSWKHHRRTQYKAKRPLRLSYAKLLATMRYGISMARRNHDHLDWMFAA